MLTFPSILRPSSGGFAPFVKSLGGGQSLSGFEQVVTSLNDRWQASFSFPIRKQAELLALRAFVMSMRGRANTVALPVFDRSRAPWQILFGQPQSPSRLRNRDLDGTVYADPDDFNSSLIIAKAAATATSMATSIVVNMVKGGVPVPGQYLSIGNSLYSATSVDGAGPFTIGIWPWLRQDINPTTDIEFASPTCEMRFQTDDQGADALSSLDLLKFATVTLKFDEAVPLVNGTVELREDGGFELRE
jgi:hypothetical protein